MSKNDNHERVTYTHVCAACGHVVAEHEYTFEVVKDEMEGGWMQEYEMVCELCGDGSSTSKV